jgi:hypothetical protein
MLTRLSFNSHDGKLCRIDRRCTLRPIEPRRRSTSESISLFANDPLMVNEDLETLDASQVHKELLREVANWKREAKSEDNERYFWHVYEVDQIARGDKYFVIGRKGSGKTAISEYFTRMKSYDVFAERLSFKNFPFNDFIHIRTSNTLLQINL